MNQLEYLKKFSTVVADSGDIDDIHKYSPQDVTTNPSLIFQVSTLPKYKLLFDDALIYAKKIGGNTETKIINASDKLAVNIGTEILKIIPGKISTEINARLSFNDELSFNRAIKIISLYQEKGIDKSRILIKLAATWEGIKAAEELEKKEQINCNLTLLFSFAQARACADAEVYLISPFVGRIYDYWYAKDNSIVVPYIVDNDPGVQSVRNIYSFYKQHGYKTIIMGASFRNIQQILSLSGCDYLTIAPKFLEELSMNHKKIERKLFLYENHLPKPPRLSVSEYRWLHNKDAMAVEKLAEGIRLFAKDQKKLEKTIAKNL